MAENLRHRGPDDMGTWADERAGVALGHTRLSIIDLSPLGHQPMVSASGRLVVVFNGEIYNFAELKKELAPRYQFRSTSDTEVMLAGFEVWGVPATLRRLVGMFAVAVWDRQENTLILARDRFGEKPLYYGQQGSCIVFGSELKALRSHPSWRGEIDYSVVASYLRFGYVPVPHSIYRHVYKLQPGTFLRITASTDLASAPPQPEVYWSLDGPPASGLFSGSAEEAVQEFERLMRQSISQQMVADVPVGAFLSGGIDSSAVVAVMQSLSSQPIRTFTIGFWEKSHDESPYATAIARHLGTRHTTVSLTPKDALDVIPKIPEIYDEPFSDSSQIPTYLVSRVARSQVTVSLSGDGGDELLGGYQRYQRGIELWNKVKYLPAPIRKLIAATLRGMPLAALERTFRATGQGGQFASDIAGKLVEYLNGRNAALRYRAIVSQWKSPGTLLPGHTEAPTLFDTVNVDRITDDGLSQMMWLDALTYLPDDILVKVDRAAMAVSLETRVPLLDHRLVEFAWTLPPSMKVKNGVSKWPLRQVLYKYVPEALMDRPKQGFGVPIGAWLRGPLKEWAEDLLFGTVEGVDSIFAPAAVRSYWDSHCDGTGNWEYRLWPILMYQAWARSSKAALAASARS